MPKYPLRCSTFLMLASSWLSTAFCTFLSSAFHWAVCWFPASTFFALISEAFLSSFLVYLLALLKKVSSTLTLTPSSETLVEVERTYAGLTLLRGTPLMAYGPETRRFPEARVFKTTTRLPLLTPESKMTTDPGTMDFLPWAGLGLVLGLVNSFFSSSAGYQVLALFLSLLLGAPPRAKSSKNY